MDVRFLLSALLALAALPLSLAPLLSIPALGRSGLGWLWLAVAGTAIALGWRGGFGPVRALLAATALIQWTHQVDGLPWPVLAGAVLLPGLMLGEDLFYRVARPVYTASRLPTARLAQAVENGTLWLVNSAAVVLVGLFAVLGWPTWTLLLPAAVAGLLAGTVLVDGWRRRRLWHRSELAALTRAVTAHQPAFLLYFSAPDGGEYQATMWLPYLERIGEPFLVVLAEPHHLPAISQATTAPVVVHRTAAALEAVMVPSLRAAFYVNNGMKNAHCVRFTRLTHVQLYHGYSDKPVSVNPIAAIFDLIFVPGQAIADQFVGSGVDLPKERFRIVGRPQAEELAVANRPVDQVTSPVVLYAPTWAGEYADSNHCSLPIGETIVRALLERGVTVIVRPHPYTRRVRESMRQLRQIERLLARDRTGRHLWGGAVSKLSLADCMNRADAMVCDVSSVASQFLYTNKPFAVTDMVTPAGGFTGSLPLARGSYVLHRDAANLDDVLDDLLRRDPRAEARRELRGYYLGDFPAERYAEAFLTEARRTMSLRYDRAGHP